MENKDTKKSKTKRNINTIDKDQTGTIIDTKELNELIKEDLQINKKKVNKSKILYLSTTILLIISIISFSINIMDKSSSIISIGTSLLLSIFTIIFIIILLTYKSKKKLLIILSNILLISYYLLNITTNINFISKDTYIKDFRNKSLTEAIKWAQKNNINIEQEYEYSDMIKEYNIISQNYIGKIKQNQNLKLSISEGPNPDKEIIVPNMISWNIERVIKYVEDNHLSNVSVEFKESDELENTVIEQSANGNLKRNDELKLTFSYGESFNLNEITLKDLRNKNKFEIEIYMKSNKLRYEIEEDYSNTIKKNYAIKQSIKPGEIVHCDDEKIIVTISKGKKVTIPDLKNMTIQEITTWAIKNKIKLNFVNKYDDTVKENKVISADYQKDDTVKQGTTIRVTISRGSLKMKEFKSINEFYDWANKYEIKYEEKHEFNDTIKAGEIISFSYKKGEAIKNDDTIIVTISDGKKQVVPNLIKLTKSEAIKKLEDEGLNYNFVYKNSNENKDIVINQSIKEGSEVSKGITITLTLSNGKKETSNTQESKKNSNNTNNNNNNNNNSNNNQNTNNYTPPKEEEHEEVVCNKCVIRGLKKVYQEHEGFQDVKNGLIAEITSQCPGIKVNIIGDETSTLSPGDPVSGFTGGETDSCSTITITIAK